MSKPTEKDVQRALGESEYRKLHTPAEKAAHLVNHDHASFRLASRICGISKKQVELAVKAEREQRDIGVHGRPRLLPYHEECELENWIRMRAQLSKYPQDLEFKEMALWLWRKSRCSPHFQEPPHFSSAWKKDFLKRHHLKEVQVTSTESKKIIQREVIDNWMEKFREKIDKEVYSPSLIMNFDETFLFPGRTKVKVIVPSQLNNPALGISPIKSEHITLAACICADGKSLKPLIIFPLKTLPTLPSSLPHPISFTGGPSGWMTTDGFLLWIKHIFLPAVTEKRQKLGNPSAKALLIYDNHSSRHNTSISHLFASNNIDVFPIPPNTSHILQPLDLTVFGVFKKTLKCSYKPQQGDPLQIRAPTVDICNS
eukprot:TRINITY_DN6653_c0_g1_i1.p1 TRINITY_DN6653_c0_g1~~TRINITY_DN6653_c0_g1_i1.p1  ORF type:complete len:391 (+),score=76.61 TRINITY_DN6653_c0_g1_i1:64-1173(+)